MNWAGVKRKEKEKNKASEVCNYLPVRDMLIFCYSK